MKTAIVSASGHSIEIKKDPIDRLLLALYSTSSFSASFVGLWVVLFDSELTALGIVGMLLGVTMFLHAGVTTLHRCIYDFSIRLSFSHETAFINNRCIKVNELKKIQIISSLARFGEKRYRIGLVDITGHVFYLVWFYKFPDANIILSHLKKNLNIDQVTHEDILSYRLGDVRVGWGAWKKKAPAPARVK